MAGFTAAMWEEIGPVYRAILELPFNRELAAGTLSRERFAFYMVQDAHYLGAFARALATAAAKATSPETQTKLAKSAHDAIVVERSLHEGFFRDFGITPDGLRRHPALADLRRLQRLPPRHRLPAPLRGRDRGPPALLPESTTRSARTSPASPPAPNPYQRWIDTYRDEAFGESVRQMLAHTDDAFDAASERERGLMREGYLKAVRYEWMFWDSAYRLEAWPV